MIFLKSVFSPGFIFFGGGLAFVAVFTPRSENPFHHSALCSDCFGKLNERVCFSPYCDVSTSFLHFYGPVITFADPLLYVGGKAKIFLHILLN